MPFAAHRFRIPLALLLGSCAVAPAPPPPPPAATPTPLPQDARAKLSPAEYQARSAEERAAEQQASLPQFQVPHEFRYQDQLAASGIRFSSRVVDDAGKDYKLVHYDHGFGLAAADVDGDGLVDLYFLTQLGRNELWHNLGGGRFEDWTEPSGLAMADQVSVGAAFGDIDNDGDADLYVTTVRHGNRMFRNEGKGRFRDISADSGTGYSGHSSGAVFFDHDRDGRLDLFVTNIGQYTTGVQAPNGVWIGRKNGFEGHLDPALSENGILYHNEGEGRFRDVTVEMGLRQMGWNGDVSATDLNDDGWVDLYLINMQGDDFYYENQQGKGFADRSREVFPRTSWGATGVKSLDWDLDGRLDLMIADMHSDMFAPIDKLAERKKPDIDRDWPYLVGGQDNIFGNSFFRGLGAGRFEEISDRIGVENYWPWGVSAGDLNADGWPDLFLTSSMSYPWRYQPNTLLLNNAGQTFLQAEYLLGVEPRAGGETMTPWFELDCSGADREHADCQGKTGKTTVMGALGSRSALIADLDEDGDLDIVTNEFGAPPQVLLSDLAAKRPLRWLKVRLAGRTSNRDGFGARVEVTSGGRKLVQEHDGGSGLFSHSRLPLYFGLGDGAAERVEVRWPSGARQTISSGIPANGLLAIEEPAAAPAP